MIRRALLWLASAFALGLAAASALIWNARRALPFNAEGRYFDPDNAAVIHQQSVTGYAMVGIVLALVGVGLGWLARRP
ncbi:hypothetical protein OIK40_12150 [Erythrobacter sp. sf7]|uniref:Uncharacterized protein n=1 Tax=Erythrobacter fulvus TaxID=2987523 RepID=A0ABT5JRK2_9SPHN|nr:hypothetical protein [Erythrobacter fulvus]MDC8755392.1 hypothetical protein [Erythrobacter fulvus]